MTQTTLLTLLRVGASSLDDPIEQIGMNKWDAVLDLAAAHAVLPWVYSCLKRRPFLPPPPVLDRLRQAALLNTARNLLLQHAYSTITTALSETAVPVIPLKGIYLAAAVYPNLGDRVIGDLDLLVPKAQIAEAMRVVARCGYAPIKSVILHAWLAQSHHVCPQHNPHNKVTVELHWHIRPPQDEASITIRPFWQRAQMATMFHTPALTLAPEDSLLHLCYHLAYHHDFLFGLRNLCDIALLCQQLSINWDALLEQATAWRMRRGVFLALRLAQAHLGAAVPNTVLQQLHRNDDIQHIAAAATAQLLTPPDHYRQISMTRRSVAAASGWERITALKNALLPSDSKMAMRYGWSAVPHSWIKKAGLRWVSLGQQAWKNAGRQSRGRTTRILRRRRLLNKWLCE